MPGFGAYDGFWWGIMPGCGKLSEGFGDTSGCRHSCLDQGFGGLIADFSGPCLDFGGPSTGTSVDLAGK